MIDVIAPNVIIDTEGFGDFDRSVIYPLLNEIILDLNKFYPFPFPYKIEIFHSDLGHSKTTKSYNQDFDIYFFIMKLDAKDMNICDWVGWFAHEYTHCLSQYYRTIPFLQKWFEETICHISKIRYLNKLSLGEYDTILGKMTPQVNQEAGNLVADYINSRNYISQTIESGLPSQFLWVVYQTLPLAEDYYEGIASLVWHLFVENPNLLKIIYPLSTSPSDVSIPQLVSHLHQNADESYRLSLEKMFDILRLNP